MMTKFFLFHLFVICSHAFQPAIRSSARSATTLSAGLKLPDIKLPEVDTSNFKLDIDKDAIKESLKLDIDKDAIKASLSNIDTSIIDETKQKLEAASTRELLLGDFKVDKSNLIPDETKGKLDILKSNWENQVAGLKSLKMEKPDVKGMMSKPPEIGGETGEKLKLMQENFAKMKSGGGDIKSNFQVGGDLQEKLNLMKSNMAKSGSEGPGLGDMLNKVKDSVGSSSAPEGPAPVEAPPAELAEPTTVSSIKAAALDVVDSISGSVVANAADHTDGSSTLHVASLVTAEVAPILVGAAAIAALMMFASSSAQRLTQ